MKKTPINFVHPFASQASIPGLRVSMNALRDLIVARYGAESAAGKLAIAKYTFGPTDEIIAENAVVFDGKPHACYAHRTEGYARTDVEIELLPFEVIMKEITTVREFPTMTDYVTAMAADPDGFEGKLDYVVEGTKFVHALKRGTTDSGLNVLLTSMKPYYWKIAQGAQVEGRDTLTLTIRDPRITEDSVDIAVFYYDAKTYIDQEYVAPNVPVISPHFVAFRKELDERLAALELDDPDDELAISKERYAFKPQSMTNEFSLQVTEISSFVRETGFMRVLTQSPVTTVDDLLVAMKMNHPVRPDNVSLVNWLASTAVDTAFYSEGKLCFYFEEAEGNDTKFLPFLNNFNFGRVELVQLDAIPDQALHSQILEIEDPILGNVTECLVYIKKEIEDVIDGELAIVEFELISQPMIEGKVGRTGDSALIKLILENWDEKIHEVPSLVSVTTASPIVEKIGMDPIQVVTEGQITTEFLIDVKPEMILHWDKDEIVTFDLQLKVVEKATGLVTTLPSKVFSGKIKGDNTRYITKNIARQPNSGNITYNLFDNYNADAPTSDPLKHFNVVLTKSGIDVVKDVDSDKLAFSFKVETQAPEEEMVVTIGNQEEVRQYEVKKQIPFVAGDYVLTQTGATKRGPQLETTWTLSSNIDPDPRVESTETPLTGTTGLKNNAFQLVDITGAVVKGMINPNFDVEQDKDCAYTLTVNTKSGKAVAGTGTYTVKPDTYKLYPSGFGFNYDRQSELLVITFLVRDGKNGIQNDLVLTDPVLTGQGIVLPENPLSVEYNNNDGWFTVKYNFVLDENKDHAFVFRAVATDQGNMFGNVDYPFTIGKYGSLGLTFVNAEMDLSGPNPTLTWNYKASDLQFYHWGMVKTLFPAIQAVGTLGDTLDPISHSYDPVTGTGKITFEIVKYDVDFKYILKGNVEAVLLEPGEDLPDPWVATHSAEYLFEHFVPSAGGFSVTPGEMRVDGVGITQDIKVSHNKGELADRADVMNFTTVIGVEGDKDTPDTENFTRASQTYTFTATAKAQGLDNLDIGFNGDLYVDDIPLPFTIRKVIPYLKMVQESGKMKMVRASVIASIIDKDGNNSDATTTFELVNMTNAAPGGAGFQFAPVAGTNHWELSGNALLDPDTPLTYDFTVNAYPVIAGVKSKIPGVLTVAGTFEVPAGPATIVERSFIVANGKATVLLGVALGDGSAPAVVKLVENFSKHDGATPGAIKPSSWEYDYRNGELKFIWDIVDDGTGGTYTFASDVQFPHYSGLAAANFEVTKIVVPSLTPIVVTDQTYSVSGTLGTISMMIRHADGTIPTAATLESPLVAATNTEGNTRVLTNHRYDPLTGIVMADIPVVPPTADGLKYTVKGRVYSEEAPSDKPTYDLEDTVVASYRIDWQKPVMSNKLITHKGVVVVGLGAAEPTSVVVQPITGAIGLEGSNPVSQNYDTLTKTITYTATAKEVTTVPVMYYYNGTVQVESETVPFTVNETVNPLTINPRTPDYCNKVITAEYTFTEDGKVSARDVEANIVTFAITGGANAGAYTPQFTWARKATSGVDMNVWVATFTVPLHDVPSNRWDWTLEFAYVFDAMNVTARNTTYKSLSLLTEGTLTFRATPLSYKQVGAPVGTQPVMEVTWLADAKDKNDTIALDAYIVGLLGGSSIANNGTVKSQAYDKDSGVLTVVADYYGNATDTKGISVSGTGQLKVPCGFATPVTKGVSFTIPKPTPFIIENVKDHLSDDRLQLKTTFKVTPEDGKYPFGFRLKMPFTSTQKTKAGTRYPVKLNAVGDPDKYYEYDPATGLGEFTFDMAAVTNGETVKFVDDLYSDVGGIVKDYSFDVIVASDFVWFPTHLKSVVIDNKMTISYSLARLDGSHPNGATVKGFTTPSNTDGVVSASDYDPATGIITFTIGITKPTGSTMTRVVINPIFDVDLQEAKATLAHDLYEHTITQRSVGYQSVESAFRIAHEVTRTNGGLDVQAGKHILGSSVPAATGAIWTTKVGSGNATEYHLYVPMGAPKTDDKTDYDVAGTFEIDAGTKLFYILPWTCKFTQFLLNRPSYVNVYLKDMILDGDQLTVNVQCDRNDGGYPQGTAVANKPFESASETLNGNLSPLSESYNSATGLYSFVFQMKPAFATNGGTAYFRSRVKFPAYGDNVISPVLDAKLEVTKAVPAPPPKFAYTGSFVNAVFTGNKLVETHKFVDAGGKFPATKPTMTLDIQDGVVPDTPDSSYDPVTGLMQINYVCNAPAIGTPVVIRVKRTIDMGNTDNSKYVPENSYTHYAYTANATNYALGANSLVVDHNVTSNGVNAINNLVLVSTLYSNSAPGAALLAHTAGDKTWQLNLPRSTSVKPYTTTGEGVYSTDIGNNTTVRIPFTIQYDEPITPEFAPSNSIIKVDLFKQKLGVTKSGAIPNTAVITKFTPIKGFLPNVSNNLSQSYDKATGVLDWNAKFTQNLTVFAEQLEADVEVTMDGTIKGIYKVKFTLNGYDMRPYEPSWNAGKLERMYYVTLNGGYNFQGSGKFIADAFAPADPGQTLGTIHNPREVAWTIRFNAAAPSATVPTQYTGNGVLELYEADGLTVHLPWTLDYTNVPPKAPFTATHTGSVIKDGVMKVNQLITNTTGDFPLAVTMGDLTSMAGTAGGTLVAVNKVYNPANGMFSFDIPIDPIGLRTTKLYRTVGSVVADGASIPFNIGVTAHSFTVEPLNIRAINSGIKVDYNLIRTSDDTSVNGAKHVLTSLTKILPGANRVAIEHYTSDVPYHATYAMDRFTGATDIVCNGYLAVTNAEKLEIYLPFSWTKNFTGPLGVTGPSVTLRDVTWTATEVTFHIHAQFNLDVHWATGSVDNPVSRVYTPARQDGAAITRQSYDANTGVIQVVFGGQPPSATPQDYQLTCVVNANGSKTDSMTFTRLLTNQSPNGIFNP